MLKCNTKTVRKIEAFVQKLQLFFNCKNRLHFTISRVFKDILYVLNNFLCSFSSFCDEFVCFPRFWWSENDFRKITKKSKIWKSFKFNQHTENFVEQNLTCSHSSEFKNCVNFLNLCSFLFVFYVIVHLRVIFYLASLV